jgi:hypothetical protein
MLKAYAAFCLYRDLGPRRTLDAASRNYHAAGRAVDQAATGRRCRASGRIRQWAERWNWNARARAWDQELGRVQRAEQLEAVKEMAERHAREALMLQNKAVERLRQLRPEELKPRETLDFLVRATRLERLARGEPQTVEEHHYQETSHEEIDIFARIEEYANAFRPVLEPGQPGLEAGGLPGHGRGEPLDPTPPDGETEAGPPP